MRDYLLGSIVLCIYFVSSTVLLSHEPFHKIRPLNELNDRLSEASNNKEKVYALIDLAHYYQEKQNDQLLSDSLYVKAIEIAKSEFDDKLIFYAYMEFLLDVANGYENELCNEVCHDLISIADKLSSSSKKFDAYYAIAVACSNAVVCDDKIAKAQRAINQANKNDTLTHKILSKLLLGRILTQDRMIRDAFQYFCDAKAHIPYLNPRDQNRYSIDHSDELYEFYITIENYDKAGEILNQQDSLLHREPDLDSAELMWLNLDYITLANLSGRDYNMKEQLEEVLEYTVNNNYLKLQSYTLSQYRSWLINTSRFSELKQLMYERFPNNLELLRKQDKSLYYLLHALIYESELQMDSSQFYFTLADRESELSNNSHVQAHFNKRYAEFYLRMNDIDQARNKFLKSLSISLDNGIDKFGIISSYELEKLAVARNSFKEAYSYSSINDSLVRAKFERRYENNITEQEIRSEADQERIQKEIAEVSIKKEHERQYFLILLIVIIGIISLLIVSSMAVQKWMIEAMAFVSVLALFEYLLLMLDDDIYKLTGDAPIYKFAVKLALFSVLFPLHHLIETSVTNYLTKHNLLRQARSFKLRKALAKLWPWLSNEAN